MARGKAEDAGGLTPAKDDNAAPYHFDPRTLPIFKCVDYNYEFQLAPPLSVARLEKGSGIILPSFGKIRKAASAPKRISEKIKPNRMVL